MDFLSIFAERLLDLILENGLTNKLLAENIDVDEYSVDRYLSGEYSPSLENLIKLANCFNITCDYLLGLENESSSKIFKACPPFKERLAFIIEKKGITKAELQRKTEIAESLIYYWLNGKYTPTVDSIIKLARYFDCSVDYLIGRTNS